MTVRVRFAPSPTGQVHIGNIRAAIFNWLFARHEGGKFLLRIEDTDRERSTPEAVKAVLDAMAWLGIDFDEPPLYQSSMREAHLKAADDLLKNGHAYLEDKGGTGKGECVMFRMPPEDMAFDDEIKGRLKKEAADMKDFVIVRSDGTPVFHLANVVDDIHMGITHVIRGDDHIENTYRHVAIFRGLGVEPPRYAHLPMIVNQQGKPYSKRDGAAFVGDFRERKFLADALFNFLALLGWSPGNDVEILPRDEMIRLFDLKRVKSAPARMDMTKFEWMNGEYMRMLPRAEFESGFKAELQGAGICDVAMDPGYFGKVTALMQERTRSFADIPYFAGFFFTEDYAFDPKASRKRLGDADTGRLLGLVAGKFRELEEFTAVSLEAALRDVAVSAGLEAGRLVHPVRVAVSGLAMGPGLFEMLEVLGRERVLGRLDRVIGRLAAGTLPVKAAEQ